MGTLLGAAQATGLRTHVRHPWRWIGASAAAWGPAMAVIFLGATTPEADWSGPAVVSLGTITGLAAGTVLGLVSGSALPSLDGAPVHNRLVLRLLRSSMHRALSGSLVALRVRGVTTGRTFELPVQYAAQRDGLVVVPGRPDSKRSWRILVEPACVEVLLGGHWVLGEAVVLRPGDPGHDTALTAYRDRWPKVRLPDDIPVVGVRLVPDRAPR
jgi:hypothetical protein